MIMERQRYIEEGLAAPATPSRSHYGNPHVTAFYHARNGSSPSSFSKILIDKKSLLRLKEEEQSSSESVTSTTTTSESASETTNSHPLSMLPLASTSESVESSSETMPSLTARGSHHRLVTPTTSFAERDSNDISLESLPDYSLPIYVPPGSPSGHQSWSSTSKRASVGLPSQYPGHHRSSSLQETVLEELQDFDELFEQSCCSANAMDASITQDDSSSSRDRLWDIKLMESAAALRDDLFDDIPSTVEAPSIEEQKALPPPPRRKGRHRRSNNQAMDKDFFDRVMKEV